MTTLTAETIPFSQIRDLRTEALSLSPTDDLQVQWCDLALADREDANDDGSPLVAPDGQPVTRTEARQVCADAINEARAQEPS